jgi:hypothetical protein
MKKMDTNMLSTLIWSTSQRMNVQLSPLDISLIADYVALAIEDGADLSMETVRREINSYLDDATEDEQADQPPGGGGGEG